VRKGLLSTKVGYDLSEQDRSKPVAIIAKLDVSGNNAVALWSSVGIVRRSSEDLGRELPWRPSVPIIVEGATEVVRYHTEVP